MNELYCRNCDKWKPLNAMKKEKRNRSGYMNMCNQCHYAKYKKNLRIRIDNSRKKADEYGVMNVLLKAEFAEVKAKKRCIYCGNEISGFNSTVDHVTPMKLGGPNARANVVQACRSCNSSKNHKPVYQFYLESETFTDELYAAFLDEFSQRNIGTPEQLDEVLRQQYEAEVGAGA
ncbi:HNH endonuclease [Metabacillus sp. RGM 3146]|uniref:HNH endonuclease n=1 Tax=Metabacillus sp. RGM 3146 TaxID=3401092 RepID=UPI003B9DB5CC